MKFVLLLLLLCTLTVSGADHILQTSAPITRWDEALPLGNGIMGCLVWGDGQPLKLALDRADLWDLRPVKEWTSPDYNYQTMRQWVKEGRIKNLHRLYDEPYDRDPAPTKIPAGRIEICFADSLRWASAELNLATALALVTLGDGSTLHIFQHATEPVGIIRLIGHAKPVIVLNAPAFGGKVDTTLKANSLNTGSLARLGYAAPVKQNLADEQSFVQTGWGGFQFAVVVKWQKKAGEWQAAWSIASTREGPDPLQRARERVNKALQKGWQPLYIQHAQWWQAFWQQSSISLPNKTIERQWYLDTYKFGAASRRGAPPITLQAIWTADTGEIPPWKGDYHHDLNTQLSYWPCYSGNHLQEGLSYLDWLWQTRTEAIKYTQHFFQKPGMNVPMTADLEGKQIGGWHQYTHSATIAAWLSQHFYLHWRYSMDRTFLKERAYPYIKESALFLESITEKDIQGKRFLPLSSSPEINDNRLNAWLPPTSNFDLALMRWLFQTAAELAGELKIESDRQHWSSVLQEFPDFSYDQNDGRLLVAPAMPLHESHRHFSHLMAIHPLSLIRWENGDHDQRIIKAALQELDRLGPDYWCGYSYAWLGSMASRAKDGARAEKALEIFSKAFCSSNSFHLNGDQTKSGYSKFTYRPFTLEGNFAAAAGVQEMLLQSHAGFIELFPAIPESWRDVSFSGLRAQGAFIVTAEKKDSQLYVEINSEQGGLLKIKNPFATQAFKSYLTKAKMVKEGSILEFQCEKGSRVILQSQL